MFYLIEGLDGVGKTTLATALAERLGVPVTKIPADELRNNYWDNLAMAYAFGACYANATPTVIRDRDILSGIAYSKELDKAGAIRVWEQWRRITAGIPVRVIYLTCPEDVRQRRDPEGYANNEPDFDFTRLVDLLVSWSQLDGDPIHYTVFDTAEVSTDAIVECILEADYGCTFDPAEPNDEPKSNARKLLESHRVPVRGSGSTETIEIKVETTVEYEEPERTYPRVQQPDEDRYDGAFEAPTEAEMLRLLRFVKPNGYTPYKYYVVPQTDGSFYAGYVDGWTEASHWGKTLSHIETKLGMTENVASGPLRGHLWVPRDLHEKNGGTEGVVEIIREAFAEMGHDPVAFTFSDRY